MKVFAIILAALSLFLAIGFIIEDIDEETFKSVLTFILIFTNSALLITLCLI